MEWESTRCNLLRVDPLRGLLGCGNPAIEYFTRRDLLGEEPGAVERLWRLPQAVKIAGRQAEDGSWRYPGIKHSSRTAEDYSQLETFRQLGVLVEKFGFTRQHPSVKLAAEFLFSRQTEEGDFRGIYAGQYAPNYNVPLQPRRDKPFSHLITGMALRAFAAHASWRLAPEAQAAGRLLMERFFKSDKYVDRRDKRYWAKVSFPFWFTDIVSALDSLSRMDFSRSHPPIRRALEWLADE